LRAPAPGAEARRRPASRGRAARGDRRRPAPGRGNAGPGHRPDPAGRGRRAPGAGRRAALLHGAVGAGDRGTAQALRAQHPSRLAEGEAVPAGVAEGRLTPMDMERWRKLSPLLDAMLELDPATRSRSMALLREEDPELGRELAALMALEEEHADFLAEPLVAPLPGP